MTALLSRDSVRDVLRGAEREARLLRSATIEAEHLLLALACDEEDPVGALLAGHGLDVAGIREALARESERSLAAVGIDLSDLETTPEPLAAREKPALAPSARRALETAAHLRRLHKHRRITSAHLLVAILRARIGTVPRALDGAGIERTALARQAERLF